MSDRRSSLSIPPEKMAKYRETARRRREERRREMERRRARALTLAHRAADLLRAQFGATRVVLFGSLARGGPFDEHSDIDLAAWGIDARQYLRAVARLLDLDPDISVDLVRAEEARPSLLESIEQEGIEL